MSVYSEGYDAGLSDSVVTCPYVVGSTEYEEWYAGFGDAVDSWEAGFDA